MSTERANRPPRRVQWLFIAVTLCYWCSMYTYVPILSPYLEDIRFNYALIGIVLGSYGFMQLVVRFPLGLWSDRLGRRKPFVLLGFAIQSIDNARRATAMGFYQAVYALGMFSGPFFAGWLNDGFGLAGGFACGAIAAFAAAAFILYGNRRKPPVHRPAGKEQAL